MWTLCNPLVFWVFYCLYWILRHLSCDTQVLIHSGVPWQGLTQAWICCQCLHHKSDRLFNNNHLIMVGNLGPTLSIIICIYFYWMLMCFCVYIAGMNMLVASHASGMDSYGSWPNNDSCVMQHNQNMSNPSIKCHTAALLYAYIHACTYLS